MAGLIEIKETEERVILIAVNGDGGEAAASLDELEELVNTAGTVCVDKIIQNREQIHPGT